MMNWQDTFLFQGKTLFYNRSEYNNFGERTVEVPIALNFLSSVSENCRILELGNVLAYYPQLLPNHPAIRARKIVDKFEVYPGVENLDLMEIKSQENYDFIVSISTIEHIGQGVMPSGAYGENIEVRDLEAPLKAIAKIYDLLRVDGQALITVPYGKLIDGEWLIQFSQDYLELLINQYKIPKAAISTTVLKRVAMEFLSDNPSQLWVEAKGDEANECEWDWPWPFANAIAVIEMTKLNQPFELNLNLTPTRLLYHPAFAKNLHPDLKESTFFILGQLRDINLIAFLDWKLSEELIASELEQVVSAVVTHPDCQSICLLIDSSNIDEEEAGLMLSSILMNICLKQNLEFKEEPIIAFLDAMNKIQWRAILPRIHARIALKTDNQQVIVQAQADRLPICDLESLSHQRVRQLATGISQLD